MARNSRTGPKVVAPTQNSPGWGKEGVINMLDGEMAVGWRCGGGNERAWNGRPGIARSKEELH
eukprot:scaffold25379_cov73-Isochrysis_galbana.AAC.2